MNGFCLKLSIVQVNKTLIGLVQDDKTIRVAPIAMLTLNHQAQTRTITMPPSDQQAENLTCLFPTRSQPVNNTPGNGGGIVKLNLPSENELLFFQKTHRLTVEQLVQAGWSAVLRRYTGSENVAFTVSSSTAVLDHTLFTCLIDESQPITTFLKNINDYYHSQDGDSLKEVFSANINTGVCCHGSDGEGWGRGDPVSANTANQVSFGSQDSAPLHLN